MDYQFGDVTEIPNEPRFVKSRPVRRDASNRNSVLLKLNSVRHYQFVEDPTPFRQKKPLAVWRGKSNRQHRIEFATRFNDHPSAILAAPNIRNPHPSPTTRTS